MAELPPELDMDNFESIIDSIDMGDLDVIDEIGEDDSDKDERDKRRNDRDRERKRSRTRSIGTRERSHSYRNRSRSPRRYGRSRSRERIRRRSPPKRKSPVKSSRGVTEFLKDIENKFGEFEGLEEARSKVESQTILKNRDRTRPQNHPRQNNFHNQQQQRHIPNNQYQNMNNGMPGQMVMPNQNQMMMPNQNQMMPMGNMMGPMMGPAMPQMGMSFPMQMHGPGLFPPGVEPEMGFNNMQPQVQFMPQQPVAPNPEPQIKPTEFRNASPPPRTSDIDLGNISSRLLSENRLNLSEYLETQASSSRSLSRTVEPRPLKDRSEFNFFFFVFFFNLLYLYKIFPSNLRTS